MDKGFFEQCMNDFGVYMLNLNSNCDIPTDDEVKNKYYQEFKNLSNRRFAKLISWLYKNWKFKTSPTIANFLEAKEATSEGPGSYNPQSEEKDTNNEEKKSTSTAPAIIARDMKIMDRLEQWVYRQKTGRRNLETSRNEALKHYIPFIKEKFENNMALNLKTKKWEKYNNTMKSKDYFIVRNYYPATHKFV